MQAEVQAAIQIAKMAATAATAALGAGVVNAPGPSMDPVGPVVPPVSVKDVVSQMSDATCRKLTP